LGFDVNWATGQTIVVEASTSLSGSAWVVLQTHTLATGSFHFTDPTWRHVPSKFYRVRPQ
jgi:hypothetical protein